MVNGIAIDLFEFQEKAVLKLLDIVSDSRSKQTRKTVTQGMYTTLLEANKAYEKACQHIDEYVDNESFRAIVNT